MGPGGYADLTIPRNLVKEVVLYLQFILQRTSQPSSLDQELGVDGIFQLDEQNNWKLIPLEGDIYRLGARYDHQALVESIAMLVRWNFMLDGWITRQGERGLRPESLES